MRQGTRPPISSESVPALILAAGEGRRLRPSNGGLPKPLTALLGLTLLERTILSCQEVGVESCYVVVGCEKEKVRAHVEALAQETSMTIRPIDNPDWQKGNAASTLAAAPYLHGSFLLLMGDVVFDPDILRCLLEAPDSTCTCLAAADRRTQEVIDLEGTTKVRIEDGMIIAWGNRLPAFDAVILGLFLCRPQLFDALKQVRHSEDPSLDGALRMLTARGEVVPVEIGNRFWIDVDTGEALSRARDLLLKQAQS